MVDDVLKAEYEPPREKPDGEGTDGVLNKGAECTQITEVKERKYCATDQDRTTA